LRPLSLAAATVLGVSPIEVIDVAARAGFAAVGVRLSPGDLPRARSYGPRTLRQARRRADQLGLSILDVEIARLRPGTTPRDFEFMLEGAALLGARHLLTVGEDPDEGRLVERLADLVERSSAYGVRPVLEFMPFSEVRTLAQALRIVSLAGEPSPGVLIDALHLARSGGSDADVAKVRPHLLPYAHLCDAPATVPDEPDQLRWEARAARLLPGQGGLPLVEFIRALPTGIPLGVEVPGAVAGTADVKAAAAATAARSVLVRSERRRLSQPPRRP
jgi:sugar phosphate isomerase/epimerase